MLRCKYKKIAIYLEFFLQCVENLVFCSLCTCCNKNVHNLKIDRTDTVNFAPFHLFLLPLKKMIFLFSDRLYWILLPFHNELKLGKNCIFASKAKINIFYGFFEWGRCLKPEGTQSEEKISKKLILVFEVSMQPTQNTFWAALHDYLKV